MDAVFAIGQVVVNLIAGPHGTFGSNRKRRKRKKRTNNETIPKPNIGDHVEIIKEPYKNNVLVKGIVKQILTKRNFNSKGHKVKLTNGTIGRTVKILVKK